MEKPWSNGCITFAYTVDECMIIQLKWLIQEITSDVKVDARMAARSPL